jgi:retron-type reverse transcriptase
VDGRFEKTVKGCHQVLPLWPMPSNIVLNELDHHLESRHLGYARWADDFVIVVRSERAAHRVMAWTIRGHQVIWKTLHQADHPEAAPALQVRASR